jgi:hypothetical protein
MFGRRGDLSGELGAGCSGQALAAVHIKFFFICIVFVLIVCYLFLKELVVFEVEGEEPVFEDYVGEVGPGIASPDQGIDDDAVEIEAYFEGAFRLGFEEKENNKNSGDPGDWGYSDPAYG